MIPGVIRRRYTRVIVSCLAVLWVVILLPACDQQPACPDIYLTGNGDNDIEEFPVPAGATFFSAFSEGEYPDLPNLVVIDMHATGHTRIVVSRIDYEFTGELFYIEFYDAFDDLVTVYRAHIYPSNIWGTLILTFPVEGGRPGGGIAYEFGMDPGEIWKFRIWIEYNAPGEHAHATIFGYTYAP